MVPTPRQDDCNTLCALDPTLTLDDDVDGAALLPTDPITKIPNLQSKLGEDES